MEDFRFEQLDIWKDHHKVSDVLFDYSDKSDEKNFTSLLNNFGQLL
jgi:hypothetical protein